MRILALETSGVAGSVAALEDDNLLLELELNPRQRSAQSLAPALVELTKRVGWPMSAVQLVAVTVGPGSFTGLRVGVTTAKSLAYVVKAEVLGVSTLEVIAQRAPDEVHEVSVAIDAQRGDVVTQSFRRGRDGWPEPSSHEHLIPLDAWLASVPSGVALSGPILRKVPTLPAGVWTLAPSLWAPTAVAVGQLAERLYRAGRRDDVWTLAPHYSRRPAAEEKLEERMKNEG